MLMRAIILAVLFTGVCGLFPLNEALGDDQELLKGLSGLWTDTRNPPDQWRITVVADGLEIVMVRNGNGPVPSEYAWRITLRIEGNRLRGTIYYPGPNPLQRAPATCQAGGRIVNEDKINLRYEYMKRISSNPTYFAGCDSGEVFEATLVPLF